MSEPLPSITSSPGLTSASSSSGPRPAEAVRLAPSEGLGVGMRVEVRLVKLITPQVLDVQIRGSDTGQPWGTPTRAQLASPLPEAVLARLEPATASSRTPAGLLQLQAEVTAVKPALVLRLLSPEVSRTPGTAAPSPPGSRDWLGQQLRHHWPASRPLTATLQGLAAGLDDPTPSAALVGLEPAARAGIQQSAAALLARLPSPADLTDAQRLPTALARSGLWLEAAVAQLAVHPGSGTELGRDLKAQLLGLAERMRAAGVSDLRPPPRAPATPRLEAPDRTHATLPRAGENDAPSGASPAAA